MERGCKRGELTRPRGARLITCGAKWGMGGAVGQRGLEIPWGTLAQAVVELHGDVEAAVTTILERAEETSSSYVQPFPVGNGSASDTNG